LCVVKRLARVPEEAVDLGVCGAKKYSPRWQRRTQRSTSASRRFLFKLRRRASCHAHFVFAAQQRAYRGRVRLVELSAALLPLSQQLLPEALEPLHGPLVEADVDGVHARVQVLHVAAAVRQLDEASA
jgi:hypothetical protein